jgi:hypothetical protein
MPEDRCNAYVAYRLACVRERIQETERLMRPPTPEELRRLQKVLQRLKAQEVQLTALLARIAPQGDETPQPASIPATSVTDHRQFFP